MLVSLYYLKAIRTVMKFEHGALGVIGCLIAALVGVNVMNPPLNQTAAPEQAMNMVTAAGPQMRPAESLLNSIGDGKAGHIPSAQTLWKAYRQMNYDFKAVVEEDARVPRVALAKPPRDIGAVREVQKRKAIFFKTVLPLILKVNEEIRADRRRLWKIRYRKSTGQPITAVDRLWLVVMSERYKVKRDDVNALLKRVDIVPPSLALAQAAEESGWGSSRFVREGNAIFGQWTFSSQNVLEPKDRDEGETHGIKTFANLTASVKAYMHNLNTHRAYREFRASRFTLRRVGAPLDGLVLATKLKRYSERGWAYVLSLRSIIEGNKLRGLDDARLRDKPIPEDEPAA
ncbi:MAG: glucosaminidase domain-containing protein [Rhodospirillales bacterium]